MIPLARPMLGEEETRAVASVLESGMLVQGARVAELEERLAALCGRRYAVACSSGTSALELALAALDVRGHEVLCPDLSWPSPAHAIARVGGRAKLVDVDPRSWNASPEGLAAARSEATRAAIVIDQFGNPADHPSIGEALGGLPTIVDAACSLGATIASRPAPSFGLVACLSFHPRKLITTGEGGACLTDDEGLAEELRIHRNHGQRAPGEFVAPAGNHRMTDLAAAIGLAQLDRLEAILARRRELAAVYRERLRGVELQQPSPRAEANHQTFGVLLVDAARRDAVVAGLQERGVQAGRLSYALHRIGSMPGLGDDASLPVASRIEDRGLALPLHPLMTDAERDTVLSTFAEVAGVELAGG